MKGRERSIAPGCISGGARLNTLDYHFFTLRPAISPSYGIIKHLVVDWDIITVTLSERYSAAFVLHVCLLWWSTLQQQRQMQRTPG